MAREQLCTFKVDSLFLGVAVTRVQEVIRSQPLTSVPLVSKVIAGLMNLRGQIVTAIDLRARLGLATRDHGQLINVVVRTDDGAVSLLVDEIGDVIEVAHDAFEPAPETLDPEARALIRGAYKLHGRLLLVLDADSAVTPENEGRPS